MAVMQRAATLLALLLLATVAGAEQARQFGPYKVHYSAINADMLAPEVASRYGIQRSGYRGVLTISVQKPEGDGPDYQYSVPAEVSTLASTMTAAVRDIDMHEVKEGEVIYYVGDFPIVDRQVLDFDVRIRPAGSNEGYLLEFRQQFFK